MKDPKTLSGIIRELSNLTGKEVSKEKEDKIINLINYKYYIYTRCKFKNYY